ncbi:MAG: UDP-N-acetylmuramoyl-L-alanyl-D-glutamate--2,6-diaminopimelate ligase [Candidatus Omnitrophica bacterium]|nr:UDP-N-acetylmuramoyl-L-alanyl-D-glutamate--2,6-diaminopimelate ligase [Candidatus Omnitrophota bacterium]MDD5488024.1 UDP-N-acetylmuramoyl-L-alanyl-D-glutamate--2,6-diaminopimelate ligase [Candidatus Omnitrophota bacterium]
MDRGLEILFYRTNVTERNIKADSRMVSDGDVFVAIDGTVNSGHDFIREALAKGAAGVVCEKVPLGMSDSDMEKLIIVKDAREALGQIVRHVFGEPSDYLRTFGITGTNGKTTTTFLVDRILACHGMPSGFISTVFNKTRGDEVTRSSLTTPDVISLNRLLNEMIDSGKKAAVIEVSSHALSQKRLSGIDLDAAVFTNITPEHLDYHISMDNYLKEKMKIFKYLKPDGIAVVNMDTPLVTTAFNGLGPVRAKTFGVENKADIMAENIELYPDRSRFDIVVEPIGRVNVVTRLIGRHNIYNILAATAALSDQDLDLALVKKAVEEMPPVPGRLDIVVSKAPFTVFVDYAHTPDALEKVIGTLKGLNKGKVYCVFGCGGNRDRAKRPLMGKISVSMCDHTLLTNDNPREEAPHDIIMDIEKGMIGHGNYSIIMEREEAIRKALGMAVQGDVVLIAGKGHEDYQVIGREVRYFNDKETALKILGQMGF